VRRRLIITTVVVLGAAGAYLMFRTANTPLSTSAAGGPALAAQTAAVGAVTVEVEPARLDAGGAEFRVTFDTHSVALDMDMTAVTRLEVDGVAWPFLGWSGDGPGGHHRQGQLSFRSGGPATGSAHLTIVGLPGPVDMVWDLTE
jgi:hypothetical protein